MAVFQKPIVMLDFETTGLSPAMGDRITEVAALRIVEGTIVERYVSLVNCGVSIPSFITHLTGISQAMVNHAPPVSTVIPELLRFIGNDALAAHNASFDAKFLLAESAALDLQPRYNALICSLKLSRRVFPGMTSYKLGSLASALSIPFLGTAHRAEADAEVSAHLLLHVAQRLAHTYRVTSIHPDLLVSVNKLAAAKVPDFLARQLRQLATAA
ncbi:3'-5' exonuclease [Glaciimonas immobilis]|uniref:DNA polymerase-3 subunit epsilon n=1 Tax=Glaciimonas immobilis TaxID=728004 RepID=A0A840RMT1_9BURK|nr:3'-5' exonuclease [Glaciimonas immobilis]KAF3999469.1 3'-5' exonuclease [Glaciimonas immobilis]MBB5198985.1 DNA polymerase-3 subunit epsilon [Glaciimonas immobilis]